MTWNYRVTKRTGEPWFTITESYYDNDDEKPHSITSSPISPGGETVDELRVALQLMLLALDKPVLEYGDF